MRKIFGIAVMAGILAATGCSSQKNLIWIPPVDKQVSEQEFRQEIYRCTQETTVTSSGGGFGYAGIAMAVSARNQAQDQANSLFIMCMQSKGYTLAPESDR